VDDFDARADAFLGAFPTLATQINAVIAQMNSYATLASASAGAGLTAASTTSLAIVSTGNITLAIASGKGFVPGLQVVVWNVANSKGMTGTVVSYSGTSLVVAVSGSVGGTGTLASWSVFAIPTVHDLSGTLEGVEVFFPPSIQSILARVASEVQTGWSRFATADETKAGASPALAVHPAGLASLVPDLPACRPALVLPFADAHALPAIVAFSRASTGSEIGQNGIVSTVAVDVPRFDFDVATGACNGLVIEAAATNMCIYSNLPGVTKRITLTGTLTGSFVVGDTVTGSGGGSGKVAHVATGYLGLRDVTVAFAATGTITGPSGSSAYNAVLDVNVLSNITVTKDAAAGPGGVGYVEKLCETAITGSFAWVAGTATITAGSVVTVQKKLKAGERSSAKIQLTNGSYTNGAYAIFNLSNGTVGGVAYLGTGSAGVAAIKDAGDGFWLCTISCIVDAASTAVRASISIYNGGVASYAGTAGYGIFMGHVQIESGPIPTSYIETGPGLVTRAADVATVALSAIDFNTAEGAMVVRGRTPAGMPSSNELLMHLDDGTTSNRIYINRGSTGALSFSVVTGGATVVSLAGPVVPNDTDFACAFSWKANDFKFSVNGADALTDTAGAVPAGLTTARIGSPTTAANMWQGPIESVVYYPRNPTAAQIKAMSL
jgi:hypothetical protein